MEKVTSLRDQIRQVTHDMLTSDELDNVCRVFNDHENADYAALESRLKRIQEPTVYTGEHYAKLEVPRHCPECDSRDFISHGVTGMICHVCCLLQANEELESRLKEAEQGEALESSRLFKRYEFDKVESLERQLQEAELRANAAEHGKATAGLENRVLERRIAELQKQVYEWEEREAAVCPENVGFEEVIKVLRRQLQEVREALQNACNELSSWGTETISELMERFERDAALAHTGEQKE